LASLRLGVRFFFQSIDDTSDAILDQGRVEVDQQAKPLVGQPQVGEKLLPVHRREALNGLDLDDHPILDNQIRAEPDVDPNRSVDHRDCLLADRPKSTLSQFIGEYRMINRFQQSWSQGGVDAKGGIHDLFGDGVLCHGGLSIVSRQDAKTPRTQHRPRHRIEGMASIPELLDGHVTLEVECLDRLYLNGYIGPLATPGGLVTFMREQLGKPIPSPVVLGQVTEKFREAVKTMAERERVPLYQFDHKERKDDVANDFRRKREIRDGVVFVGVAQEKAQAFQGKKIDGQFWFTRDKTVYVNHYYFYIDDADFGPLFLKVCSYAPWSTKLCLNGHEWAKRQLEKKGIAYEALDNGFLSCAEPKQLQQICDSLGPEDIDRVFRKWLARIPLPLRREDREAGYDWNLSIWQMEVSLTQIFDRPLRGREFFEEIIRDNLDLGRPDRVQLVFDRVVTKKTPGEFRTRVIQDGVHPSLHISYKNFDLKQYFKEGRGCRTEGTFRNPKDFDVNKGLSNLPYLQKIGREINRRLLEVERVSHNSGLSGDSIQRVVQPTVTQNGEKAPALKFGQPRVMALLLALTLFQHLIDGFHNRDLRGLVADLLGVNISEYTGAQMTYDLRRLRLKGLIFRPPRTHRYFVTPYGWKLARLFSRLEARVFRPAVAMFTGNDAVLPFPLRASLDRVDAQLDELIYQAFPQIKVA
jgi:hypothetical protein